jgi:hypothetical protein
LRRKLPVNKLLSVLKGLFAFRLSLLLVIEL